MMTRLRNIGLLILLLLAGRMAAQVPVLDSVCSGAVRHYGVYGEPGSTYSWTITPPAGPAVLLPSDADTVEVTWTYPAGIYELKAIQHALEGCDADAVYGQVIIFEQPAVSAGPDALVCSGSYYKLVNATADNTSSLLWETSGDGTFDDNTILLATYAPGASDILAGTVTLTLTGQGLLEDGGCDPSVSTIVLTIVNEIVPTFEPIGPLCQYSMAPALPDTSLEGITGTWEPPTISTGVAGIFLYTFNPDPVYLCVLAVTIPIIILPEVTPEFDTFGPLCQFSIPPALPDTSNNGIAGMWEPPIPDTDEPGTFYFTFTPDEGQCAGIYSMAIVINALPVVYAGADQAIPVGASTAIGDATASGTGPLTFSWTPAGLLIDPSVLNPTTVNLGVTTVFTLIVADSTGCESSDQVTIFVEGLPLVVDPSAEPEEICPGGTVQLFANAAAGSGTYTYSWTSIPAGFVSIEENPAVIPSDTTNYNVEVSDGFDTVTGSVTVIVHTQPVVSCPEDQAVCIVTAPFELTGALPVGGTYSGTGVSGGLFDPSSAGTGAWEITYTYYNEFGCSNSCTFTITVSENPQVTGVQASEPHCDGPDGQLIISASSPTGLTLEYSIDGGFTYVSGNVFAGLTAGVYNVRVRDNNGCEGDYDSNPVVLNDVPAPLVSQTNVSNETDGSGNGAIEIIATGSTPQLFYTINGGAIWQTGDGLFANLSAGSYLCIVKDENDCDTSFTIIINNIMNNSLHAITIPGGQCMGDAAIVPLVVDHFVSVAKFQLKLSYNVDYLLCEGYLNPNPLLAGFGGNVNVAAGVVTLYWESTSPVTFTSTATVCDLLFTPKQAGLGQLDWYTGETDSYFTDLAGNPIPAEFYTGQITIYDPPVILLSASKTVCEADTISLISVSTSMYPPVIYQWTYPDGHIHTADPFFAGVTQADAGDYTLLATDSLGCTDQKTIHLVVSANPLADFHDTDTLTVPRGYVLDAGSGMASYHWNTGGISESITIDTAGLYIVQMVSHVGCTGSDSVYIILTEIPPECLYVPNAFTPDNDGLNDTFKAVSVCPLAGFRMLIFNRWGEKLFETNDISEGWDGKKNGASCPGDIYVYKIAYTIDGAMDGAKEEIKAGTVLILK